MTPKKQLSLRIPEPLYQALKRHCGGNLTRFILEAVRERLLRLERERLEEELAEGYRCRAEEHRHWGEAAAPIYGDVLMAEG